MTTVLHVEDITDRLRVSRAWVYAHADQLGGVRIGGKVFFTEEGLANALQGPGEMAGSRQDKRSPRQRDVSNEGRGKILGGGDESRNAAAYLREIGAI